MYIQDFSIMQNIRMPHETHAGLHEPQIIEAAEL